MSGSFKVDTTSHRTMLVISSGYHLYREYLLRLISSAARVWLFLDQEPTWERQYVVGCTRIDTLDVPGMIAAARALPDHISINGVICWDEIRVVHAAKVAKALVLPSGPPDAIARCRDKHETRTALAEESMEGPEISVAAAFVDGDMQPMFVARKVTGVSPHFEAIGHVVNAADPLLDDPQLRRVLTEAHRAVGLQNGITHTELRLTAAGPKIVEIDARLGGDMIPFVGWRASGIDPGRAAVDVACGQPPQIQHRSRQVAAIRFFYPPCDATVASIQLDDALLPPGIEAAGLLVKPGQRLVLPPADHVSCRYGYAVVRGESAEACDTTALAAERAFTLALVAESADTAVSEAAAEPPPLARGSARGSARTSSRHR